MQEKVSFQLFSQGIAKGTRGFIILTTFSFNALHFTQYQYEKIND